MTTPHKHHDCIVAWAKGAQIQVKAPDSLEWTHVVRPLWLESYEYRVKPEPKPDVVSYGFALIAEGTTSCAKVVNACSIKGNSDNIKLVFDGETGKLKSAEVI
jgi:hypothetical protein